MEINGFTIEPQSGNAGTYSISISVSAINEGLDKTIMVSGVCGDKTAPLTINYEGMRELFICTDGIFNCSEGTFNVLKI